MESEMKDDMENDFEGPTLMKIGEGMKFICPSRWRRVGHLRIYWVYVKVNNGTGVDIGTGDIFNFEPDTRVVVLRT